MNIDKFIDQKDFKDIILRVLDEVAEECDDCGHGHIPHRECGYECPEGCCNCECDR